MLGYHWKRIIVILGLGSIFCWYSVSRITTEEVVSQDQRVYSANVFRNVSQFLNCEDKELVSYTGTRGDFLVFYNYVPAQKKFKCQESITYTTHTEYMFLDNLEPVVERWQGPVSVTIYAPGDDFSEALKSIVYLRECATPLVKDFVTFHIYFDLKHAPEKNTSINDVQVNCNQPAPYLNVSSNATFRKKNKLLYPINVARNVARETAQTFFVLPSDIELYPSKNIIPNFLTMIRSNTKYLQSEYPKVFPLSIFEVESDCKVPENKTVLLRMLANGTAHPFHEKICLRCHKLPNAEKWQSTNETQGLHVFGVGKRSGTYRIWEPIFIGTNLDPFYDERLTWEGQRDKMTQGYAFCVLDYNFLILDNAFLVHRPGVKVYQQDDSRLSIVYQTNEYIERVIEPELIARYGTKYDCGV